MKKNILFFTLFLQLLAASLPATAKRTEPLLPLFEKLKKRTLIVTLATEKKELYDDILKKSGKQAAQDYSDFLKETNQNIVKAVSSLWKLNKKIVFIHEDSINEFIKKAPESYGLLTFYDGLAPNNKDLKTKLDIGEKRICIPTSIGIESMALFLPERDQPIAFCHLSTYIAGQGFDPKDVSTEARKKASHFYIDLLQLHYIIGRFNWLYEDAVNIPETRQPNAILSGLNGMHNYKKLQTLTLVVRQSECEKKFDVEKISEYYPYKIQVASDAEFEKMFLEAARTKDKTKAFVFVIQNSSNASMLVYIQEAMLASDGQLIAYYANELGISYKMLKFFKEAAENPKY